MGRNLRNSFPPYGMGSLRLSGLPGTDAVLVIGIPSREYILHAMPQYLTLLGAILPLLLCTGVASAWYRWLRFRQREQLRPRWRAGASFVGLWFATFSSALSIFLLVHAAFTGGYSFYHPVELFCIRFGGLTALLGIVASIAGKGRLRLYVAALSALNLFLWFMDAMFQ